MNKLLTTITLLCFSVAANADIYFCESTSASSIDTIGERVFSRSGNGYEGATWIVDTDKGFRTTKDEDYSGSCEKVNTILVYCNLKMFGDFQINLNALEFTFAINTETLTFTQTSHHYGEGVEGYAGTCTKA